MTADAPSFTVVTPTYNRAETIGRAVRSVLEQTCDDLELIVVDDGSTDETRAVVAAFDDARVRYVRQDNRGRCAARNRGIAESQGTWVTFLDSDDEAMPHWLGDLGNALGDDVGIVCSPIVRQEKERAPAEEHPRDLGLFFGAPGLEGLFVAGSFAVRRELLEAVGGYAEELTFSENTELALRLIPACQDRGLRIATTDRPTVVYHVDRSRPTTGALRGQLASSEYILAHHQDAMRRDPTVHGYYLGSAGVRAARLGEFPKARRYFGKAIRMHPRNWRHYGRWLAALVPPVGRRVWAVDGH